MRADPIAKSPLLQKILGFLVSAIATAALGATGALWTRVSALEGKEEAGKVRDHFVEQGIADLKSDVAAVREQLTRKLGK